MPNLKKYLIVPANSQSEGASDRLQDFNKAYPQGIAYADKELAEVKAAGMSKWLNLKLTVKTIN
jgi:hypothetical protein